MFRSIYVFDAESLCFTVFNFPFLVIFIRVCSIVNVVKDLLKTVVLNVLFRFSTAC